MRELKLRYLIELVSNIDRKADDDAKRLTDAQKAIQKALGDTEAKLGLTERALLRLGGVGTASIERQARYLTDLALKWERVRLAAGRVNDEMERHTALAAKVGAGGFAAKAAIAPSIKAYSDLESADVDLRIAMTNNRGQVSPDYGRISQQAVQLGAKLPGTTRDYMSAARALVTQGVPSSVIANGGLASTSYMAALLDLPRDQAAEITAKLREAFGLKDNELVPMSDLVQRAFFGFGIKPQEYLETAKYAAPTFNTMGITGLEKTRETLAIQGMAANVGLEASSFGTNYAAMLMRLAQIDPRLHKKNAEARATKALLAEHGIDMSFYDDAGAFKGNVNLLQQLAKLRGLNPLEQTRVLHQLFGVEGGRPAQILVQKGLEGYQAALSTIDSQANLDTRVNMRLDTFSAKGEAATGSLENFRAAAAQQLGDWLKPVIDKANDIISGSFTSAVQDNPLAGTFGLLGLGTGAAWGGANIAGGLMARVGLGGAAEALMATGAGGVAATALPYATVAGVTGAVSSLVGRGIYDYGLEGTNGGEGIGMAIASLFSLLGNGTARDALALREAPTWERLYGGGKDAWFSTPFGALSNGTGAAPTLQVGTGKLEVAVTVHDDRTSVSTAVTQQPSAIKLDVGNTNPAGYTGGTR